MLEINAQNELDLSGRQLTSLAESTANLHHLEKLNLDQNRLTALPASIGQLKNLATLSLYGNRLAALPEEIWQLKNLATLNLAENHFSFWNCPILKNWICAGTSCCRLRSGCNAWKRADVWFTYKVAQHQCCATIFKT